MRETLIVSGIVAVTILAIIFSSDEIEAKPKKLIYEVSTISVIQQGNEFGQQVSIQCLDGDFLHDFSGNGFKTFGDDSNFPPGATVGGGNFQSIHENPNSLFGSGKKIGVTVQPRIQIVGQPNVAPFDISVTITIVCLSLTS